MSGVNSNGLSTIEVELCDPSRKLNGVVPILSYVEPNQFLHAQNEPDLSFFVEQSGTGNVSEASLSKLIADICARFLVYYKKSSNLKSTSDVLEAFKTYLYSALTTLPKAVMSGDANIKDSSLPFPDDNAVFNITDCSNDATDCYNINLQVIGRTKTTICLTCDLEKELFIKVAPQEVMWVPTDSSIDYNVCSNTNWILE